MVMEERTSLIVPAGEGRRMLVLGNEIEIKLSCSETAGAAFVFENTTPPGDGAPPHIHTREDEMIHVIAGDYEIFLGGKTYRATAGAVVNFPRSIAHGFRNVGSKPARALFIVTPGENFERFFQELSVAAPHVPADKTKLSELFSRYGLPIVEVSSEVTTA